MGLYQGLNPTREQSVIAAKRWLQQFPDTLAEVKRILADKNRSPVKLVSGDFETYSECNLKKHGAWVYGEHPSTEPICFMYAFDGDEDNIRDWIPTEKECIQRKWSMPADMWVALFIDGATFSAQNDFFEFCIWNLCLKWPTLPVSQQEDTMAWSAAHALPLALDKCALALGTKAQKDRRGAQLIQLLSKPVRGHRNRDPGLLQEMYEYCRQDVRTELGIRKRLKPLVPSERKVWELDRKINIRGVRIDGELAVAALDLSTQVTAELDKRFSTITGGKVASARKRDQVLNLVQDSGIEVADLRKTTIKKMLEDDTLPERVREILELRLESSKASVAKYSKAFDIIAADGRAHGLLQYHGATTGRWAGRMFQPQNLPRPSFNDTDACIDWILARDIEMVGMFWGSPMEAMSSCLRGLIQAAPGKRLIAADYSAIEARMLAWGAGQEDIVEVFRSHGKIYEYTAQQIYGIPWEEIDKESMERLIGKVANLALGYQGAAGAFLSMAAVYGIMVKESLVKKIVNDWREANDKIVNFWYDLDRQAIRAVKNPGHWFKGATGVVSFACARNREFLYMKLPSGRMLAYYQPRVELVKTPWGKEKEQVTHLGFDKKRRWCRIRRYGGSWTENWDQAASRDLIAHAMPKLEEAGYEIILTVHDEIIGEAPEGHGSLKEFNQIMCTLPEWAKGLPVKAAGFETIRYRK